MPGIPNEPLPIGILPDPWPIVDPEEFFRFLDSVERDKLERHLFAGAKDSLNDAAILYLVHFNLWLEDGLDLLRMAAVILSTVDGKAFSLHMIPRESAHVPGVVNLLSELRKSFGRLRITAVSDSDHGCSLDFTDLKREGLDYLIRDTRIWLAEKVISGRGGFVPAEGEHGTGIEVRHAKAYDQGGNDCPCLVCKTPLGDKYVLWVRDNSIPPSRALSIYKRLWEIQSFFSSLRPNLGTAGGFPWTKERIERYALVSFLAWASRNGYLPENL